MWPRASWPSSPSRSDTTHDPYDYCSTSPIQQRTCTSIQEIKYLRHADSKLLHALVHLLHKLVCNFLHDQHHLDSGTPLPTVAEPSLNKTPQPQGMHLVRASADTVAAAVHGLPSLPNDFSNKHLPTSTSFLSHRLTSRQLLTGCLLIGQSVKMHSLIANYRCCLHETHVSAASLCCSSGDTMLCSRR